MTSAPSPLGDIPEPSSRTYVNIHGFQAFNAMSYTIALGSPLTLFARELGASASVIGLMAAFTPMLAMLQLLVAPHAAKVGYRPIVMQGWSSRVVSLILLCAMPFLAPILPREVSIAALVGSMFVFNLLRGFAAGSWLPWTTALIPRGSRARFLGRDRTFIAVATVAALGISGTILSGEHTALGYSAMFGLSFLAGAISLFFLGRIPPAPPQTSVAGEPVRSSIPWRAIFKDQAFMRYAIFSVGAQFTLAAATAFIVVFIRDEVGLGDGYIIQLGAVAQAIAMVTYWFGRKRLDAVGSKRYIGLSLAWWVIYFGAWFAMAGHLIPSAALVAPVIMIVNGLAGALNDLAGTRLLMNMSGDREGSSQYFAVQQTGSNLATGVSPILWGAALDAMAGGSVGRYLVFFGAEVALVIGLAVLLWKVKER